MTTTTLYGHEWDVTHFDGYTDFAADIGTSASVVIQEWGGSFSAVVYYGDRTGGISYEADLNRHGRHKTFEKAYEAVLDHFREVDDMSRRDIASMDCGYGDHAFHRYADGVACLHCGEPGE